MFEIVIWAVAITILVILVVLFLVYIIGNVFNGFVKRKMNVETSFHELKKMIDKTYSFLPEIIEKCPLDEDIIKVFREVYNAYLKIDLETDIEKMAEYDLKYSEVTRHINLNSIPNTMPGFDILEFMLAERRNLNFSIPLYNKNVRAYEAFRKLPVNRVFARMFKFNEKHYFMPIEKINSLKEEKRLPR